MADIDRQLSGQVLALPDNSLEEDVVPLFVAPPDVCADAQRTLLFGVVPTVSSELSEAAPAATAPGAIDFSAQSSDFKQHLAAPLQGFATAFPFAGADVAAGWFDRSEMPTDVAPDGVTSDQFNALSDATSDDALAMRDFLLLLRQLGSEFNVFDGGSEADAARAVLAGIRLPLVLLGGETVQRTVPALDFLSAATSRLLKKDVVPGVVEMPESWPTLNSSVLRNLQTSLHGAMQARAATLLSQSSRYDEPGARYTLRAFVRIKARRRLPIAHRLERARRPVRHRAVVRKLGRAAAAADPAARRQRPQHAEGAEAQCRLRRPAFHARNLLSGKAKDLLFRQGQHQRPGADVDLRFQHPRHHDLRLHRAEHIPDLVQPDLRLAVLHQGLYPVSEVGQEMSGWPLLPLPDATGALAWPDQARSVRETYPRHPVHAPRRTADAARLRRRAGQIAARAQHRRHAAPDA